MPTVLRTYGGHGRFSFDFGLQIVSDFNATARSDGDIEVSFKVPVSRATEQIMTQSINRRKNPPEASLIGHVTSPSAARLTARRLVLGGLKFAATPAAATLTLTMMSLENLVVDFTDLQPSDAVKLRHGLTNLIFGGCLGSPTATGWSRDKFKATLEGREVTYRQLPNYRQMAHNLGQDVVVTSEAIIQTRFSEYGQATSIVEDSLMLLSFASGTYVASVYEDVFREGILAKSILKAVKTMPFHGHDCCVDVRNPSACDLQIFLETSFLKYKTLRQDLGLEIVLEYYLQAKQTPLPELKYLVGVVGIECLLSYVSRYFSKTGTWKWERPTRSLVKRILGRATRRTLRKTMIAFLDEFTIPYTKRHLKFIGMRDSLVHTGRFPRSVNGRQAYDELIQFLDRILLRLLGYHGRYYLNRLNSFRREILP